MELSILLLEQIISMVLMALSGFVLGRMGLITGKQSRVLSCVCVYLCLPCSMIASFSTTLETEKLVGLGLGLVAAVLIHLLYLLLDRVFSCPPAAMTREEQALVTYNNAGNLIMPMVRNILGLEYVLYTSSYILVQNLLVWTHGQKLMGGEQTLRWKKVISNPVIAGIGIGLLLFMTGLPLPAPLRTAVEGFSGCMAPLCMLVTGIVMSELDLKKAFSQSRVYLMSLIRLILLPLLSVGILLILNRLFPIVDAANILTVSLLCAIGPSASTIVQQAQIYHNPNVGYVSSVNAMTTVLCAVTMPLITLLFRSAL